MTLTCSRHSVEALDDAMTVMATAFDPAFGEGWSAAQCSGVLAMPGATLIVARADSVPIGFALVRALAGEAELMLLGVSPDARGRGVGRRLVEDSFAVARAAGCSHYFLEVRSDNPAISLYHRLSFVQVGIRRNYYRGTGGVVRDALTYRRALS